MTPVDKLATSTWAGAPLNSCMHIHHSKAYKCAEGCRGLAHSVVLQSPVTQLQTLIICPLSKLRV
jgi:hypothetical protein